MYQALQRKERSVHLHSGGIPYVSMEESTANRSDGPREDIGGSNRTHTYTNRPSSPRAHNPPEPLQNVSFRCTAQEVTAGMESSYADAPKTTHAALVLSQVMYSQRLQTRNNTHLSPAVTDTCFRPARGPPLPYKYDVKPTVFLPRAPSSCPARLSRSCMAQSSKKECQASPIF